MTPPKIRMQGLTKSFGERGRRVVALDDFTLSVADGEFVCLVGPSGCGKTTALRIVAGLETADSGTLDVIPGADKRQPQNAMVFQEHGLFPWMTVVDNVAYGLEMRGVRKRARREQVEPFLEMIGLARFRHHYPRQLSGGMRQRVSLARAFVADPEILLMDEPFGALDAQTREVMHDLILHVFQLEKATIVFVTHDVEEAIYLGQRVVLLAPRPGRIDTIYKVPLPAQRHQDMKHMREFLELKKEILQRIRETSGMKTDSDLLEQLSRTASTR